MTVGEWLRARTPRPPAALAARIETVLGDALAEPVSRVPAVCLEAGERLASDLLARNSSSRESALDLLTADALVTYAFEAGGDSPAVMDDHAAGSMRRIAALAIANR